MHNRVLATLLALALFVTACGDDDDAAPRDDAPAEADRESTTSEADEAEDGEQAAGADDFCAAYQELLAGDPSPDAIRDVAAIAPKAAQDPMEALAAGFEEDPEGFFDTEQFGEAFAEVGAVANEECADEVLDVTTVEYEFQGVPEELSPGLYGVNLQNEGDEFHEMVVFRKNEDVTESFDEIFADGPEAIDESALTEIGGAFAPPGGGSGGLFDMDEPGDYIAVCFVPVGTTDVSSVPEEAQPHYAQGMQVQFTVG